MTNTEAKYAANIGKMVKCVLTTFGGTDSITKYAVISNVEKAFNNKFRYELRYLNEFTPAEHARFGKPNKIWCKEMLEGGRNSREFKATWEE
jgi:hypothetical protein